MRQRVKALTSSSMYNYIRNKYSTDCCGCGVEYTFREAKFECERCRGDVDTSFRAHYLKMSKQVRMYIKPR